MIDQTKNLGETINNFWSFVVDRNLNLESLSSSPILFMLVIWSWKNTIEDEKHLNGLSLCALYTSLFESLCKKANSAIGYFNDSNPPPVHCFSSTSYIQPNIDHLDKLAEVACKLLFSSERESSIVFSDMKLSNYFSPDEFQVRKTFAFKSGILTNKKDKNRTESSNSFVHKTVQEHFAAYHIACNPYLIDDVISRYFERHNTSYLEIAQVFIFLCGMNIFAANKLSVLMNQYDIKHCNVDNMDITNPCEFQRIIESGIREAAANNQDYMQLKLSRFSIQKMNIRDLNHIWSTNTFNAQGLYVMIYTHDVMSSSGRSKPTSNFEFNLSSCHKLKILYLWGSGIWLKEKASAAKSDLPVWIVLNNADPAQCADPPPVLPSIKQIDLHDVTLSSTWLRSLLSTLLSINHEVQCNRWQCHIISCVEGSGKRYDAQIKTGLNNKLQMDCLWEDSPGLWEAFQCLNIKHLSMRLSGRWITWKVNHVECFSQTLSSLTQLETLSISVNEDRPGLWEALSGLNIKSLSLDGPNPFGLKVNHVGRFSQTLSSLTQLETLSIIVREDIPGLWEALRGPNIKSLSVGNSYREIKVNHVESFSQCLASLTQLATLIIYLREYIDIRLPQSLQYFNIYCVHLHPSELRDLLHTMAACTQKVESRLQFGYMSLSNPEYAPLEECIDIQQKIEELKNIKVKRFRIYERTVGSMEWSVRYIGVVEDDDHDNGSVDIEGYNGVILKMNVSKITRIAMLLQILPV
ncbi:hypothetical protein DPMN_167676 [Dreissena polymorpha]|uniref:Uncharacterized protein n=1 Tax=Dreissena polymorpha TaxID=45954 RepID=A0A9D4F496_DREPO|nr:hypothetical protein DPMN_167676 [Dreissena polymorpha]